MNGPSHLTATRSAKLLVLWCVLVALPVYGLSGTVVALIGSSHVHRAPAMASQASPWTPSPAQAAVPNADDPMAGWQDPRRIVAVAAIGGHDGHTHGPAGEHRHDALERHHHAPGDGSVIALDGESHDDAGGPQGGTAALVLGLIGNAEWRLPDPGATVWPADAAPRITTRGPAPLERPPRA